MSEKNLRSFICPFCWFRVSVDGTRVTHASPECETFVKLGLEKYLMVVDQRLRSLVDEAVNEKLKTIAQQRKQHARMSCPRCKSEDVVIDGPPGGILDVSCKSCGWFFDSYLLRETEEVEELNAKEASKNDQ